MQNEELEGIPNQDKIEAQKPTWQLTPKTKKILALGSGIFSVFIFSLLLYLSLFGKKPSAKKIPIITPGYFVVTATPPLEPTQWASNSAVVKIKSDLASLSGQLNIVDLNEPILSLPNIDLRVTFQK
ncbi:MAG: hypothetical protein M1120_03790 [Patescibacteria group bacterium]|nr:hypothetical protein [Patescibacteria group bacterium]